MSGSPGLDWPTVIVTDTSTLINFLRIDRMDLIADHSHAFLATDHVVSEISDRYPDQQRRLTSAIAVEFQRGYTLAIDDRVASRLASRFTPSLQIVTTKDLMLSMIR